MCDIEKIMRKQADEELDFIERMWGNPEEEEEEEEEASLEDVMQNEIDADLAAIKLIWG